MHLFGHRNAPDPGHVPGELALGQQEAGHLLDEEWVALRRLVDRAGVGTQADALGGVGEKLLHAVLVEPRERDEPTLTADSRQQLMGPGNCAPPHCVRADDDDSRGPQLPRPELQQPQ